MYRWDCKSEGYAIFNKAGFQKTEYNETKKLDDICRHHIFAEIIRDGIVISFYAFLNSFRMLCSLQMP